MSGGYPPNMTLRPLTGWPFEFTRQRRRSQFSSTWSATLDLLQRELWQLNQGHGGWYPPSVLQIALREQDFRKIDGLPRANSIPDHPGVILNIEPPDRPTLSFPCDTFDRWQDNLRAIALTLEALRKIDRYGVTQTGQQYRGWQAIEAKTKSAAELVAFLAKIADDGVADTSTENIARLLRRAQFNAHPDRNNGERDLWEAVEQTANQLRRMGWL